MQGDKARAEHQPGDICGQSGLYEVVHQLHRKAHTVMVAASDVFPPCKHCGQAVRFRLVGKSLSGPKRLKAKAARKRL